MVTLSCGARRRSGLLIRSALAVFCFAAALPTTVFAQVPQGYEEGIVAVVAERLAPLTTIVLVDPAGSILLPVDHVTRYLGLTGSWNGSAFTVPAIGGTAAIDTATLSLLTPSGRFQLARAELVAGPTLYLRADRVAELLDATVAVDFATLTATMSRSTPFPAQQRVIAEQRRAVLIARQQQQAARAHLSAAPYHPATGVGIADWEIVTNGLDPARLTTIRTAAGVALFGGDLNGSVLVELGRDANETLRESSLRYHRVFPQGRWLTQVRAGDVLTTGLFGRYVRGIELSNRPFRRPAELSTVLVEPDLPTGWDYEVFQGSQLLGYSDPGSLAPVAVPLRPGATPVHVRMYGPAGEELVTTLLYQTPASLLRHESVEYSVGAGHCTVTCDEIAHADVRYGVTPLFTAGGGFEVVSDSAGRSIRPYLVYSLSTGTRATAELTYMPFALYAANIALFPRDGSSAHVRGSIARPGFGPISLVRETRMRWDTELLWDERIERPFAFSQVRFGASAAGRLGAIERWRFSSTGSFSRGFLEARYDHDRISVHEHLLSARGALFLPVTFGTRTLRPLLTAAAGVSDRGLQIAELGLSVQPRANAVITAGAQWSRDSDRPTLSLGYSAHIGSLSSALRAVSSPDVASSSFMIGGSTSFASDGSLTFQPFARTGFAGLHGTVFADADGDGVLSDTDIGVPGLHLIVGGHRTVTDEHGRFRIWGLQPYESVLVAIDSARTPDPAWAMAGGAVVIRPVPNTALRTDVRLVRTRELIGSITAAPGVPTVASLTIHITDLDSGELSTTTTFSDGLFYLSRIPPGRYALAVAPSSLDVLGAIAAPALLEFTIPATGDEPLIELPPIQLSPR